LTHASQQRLAPVPSTYLQTTACAFLNLSPPVAAFLFCNPFLPFLLLSQRTIPTSENQPLLPSSSFWLLRPLPKREAPTPNGSHLSPSPFFPDCSFPPLPLILFSWLPLVRVSTFPSRAPCRINVSPPLRDSKTLCVTFVLLFLLPFASPIPLYGLSPSVLPSVPFRFVFLWYVAGNSPTELRHFCPSPSVPPPPYLFLELGFDVFPFSLVPRCPVSPT